MKNHINLLSWQFRLRLLVRRRVRQWAFVWGAVVLIGGCLWSVQSSAVNAIRDDLDIRLSKCEPLRRMKLDNGRMRQQFDELNDHQSLLARLESEQVPFHLIAVVSQGVARCEGRIHVQEMAFERRELNGEPALPEALAALGGRAAQRLRNAVTPPDTGRIMEESELSLSGIAIDNIAIARFVAALRDTNFFDKVDLKSSLGAESELGRTQSYHVVCSF